MGTQRSASHRASCGGPASRYAVPVDDISEHRFGLSRGQKLFKGAIYSLLIINFCVYLAIDVGNAAHTLNSDASVLNITSAFAVSSGVFAWLLLIALLELETYALDDEAWTGRLTLAVHAVRLGCFILIGHTVFAVVDYTRDLYPAIPIENVQTLCDLADQERSWTHNLHYQEISRANCERLSDSTPFYAIPDSPVVTDSAGLALERQLAWGDVIEIFAWLLIILATEVLVRLQERRVTGGHLVTALRWMKFGLYGILILLALWWSRLGHHLYTWDTFLWIGGFSAIEMNLKAWRQEIVQQRQPFPEAQPDTKESPEAT